MFGKRCYGNQFIDVLNSIRNLDSAEILMNKLKNMLKEFQKLLEFEEKFIIH